LKIGTFRERVFDLIHIETRVERAAGAAVNRSRWRYRSISAMLGRAAMSNFCYQGLRDLIFFASLLLSFLFGALTQICDGKSLGGKIEFDFRLIFISMK
jgi:hypothetical protein